jgi:hypothetical protein
MLNELVANTTLQARIRRGMILTVIRLYKCVLNKKSGLSHVTYAMKLDSILEFYLQDEMIALSCKGRPLKNAQFCSRSKKARILTTGIP